MSLTVRTISTAEHLAFIAACPSASFLQCPSWAAVKAEWGHESIGWCDTDGKVVGAGLVLYRRIPRLKRYLAYLPEGPVLAWSAIGLAELPSYLEPMLTHLRSRRCFGVRMGPPVVTRRWSAGTVKAAVADGHAAGLDDLAPDTAEPAAAALAAELARRGWLPPAAGAGFTAGQPRHVFQLPLAGRSLEEVFAGFNEQWRRNVRKADKAGVAVEHGSAADLAEFHRLYLATAARDRFTPRPAAYFHAMAGALSAEDPDRFRLYLARHDGDLLAATIAVRVGAHVWYSYGASAELKREVRASNAVQWRMISDAHAAGAAVYDLRGITDTLDPADPLFGLIRFKLGTGGEAVEYLGEWDYPINSLLYKAFRVYLTRRR